jgi:dCMP deaminase
MQIAEVVAERSHDAQTKVGALLISNASGAILATGFNGYEYILHAEQNLIANCARHGISMENSTLICTLSPCKLCMRLLVNCGITTVIARDLYSDFESILMMEDVKVNLSTREDGLYEITYSVD